MLGRTEGNGFTGRVEDKRDGRGENVRRAFDEHPWLGGSRFIMFLNDTHHPLVARVEGDLEDLLVGL